jgi:hypothetical protein
MLVPMLVPAIFTSALIFGPAFVITLAVFIGLLVKFSSLKGWIGVAMAIVGMVEFSLVPDWVLWLFLVGLCTLIIGIIMLATALATDKVTARAASVAVVFGIIGILAATRSLLFFAIWLSVLIFGTAAVATLLPEQKRVNVGLVFTVVGLCVTLISMYTNFLALAFFVGFEVMFTGISVIVSGLPYWAANRSGGNSVRRLRKSLYVILAIVVLSSAVVFSLRSTRVLREELYDDWTYATVADTTVRGVVTGIYLNCEVNNHDYSYHVFPALIIVNVTEVIKADLWAMNLTETREHWMNQNMTVAYDRSDVPSLTVGERVEASGYYDLPVEDSWSYSNKLVIAAEINGSQVTSLPS